MISLPLSKLKEILIKGDVATEETINGLYEEAERRKQNVIDLIVSEGLVREERFYDLLAESLSVQRVNLGAIKIDENVLRLISQDVAERRRVILFKKESDGSFAASRKPFLDVILRTHSDGNFREGARRLSDDLGGRQELSLRSLPTNEALSREP